MDRAAFTRQDQIDTIRMDAANDDREEVQCDYCDSPATHSYRAILENVFPRKLRTVHICDWCLARDPQAQAEIAEEVGA